MTEFAFNHDGFGALEHLADTDMTEADAVAMLVQPIVDSKLTAIDWCTLTTGEHNCRTRHKREALFDSPHGKIDVARVLIIIAHKRLQALGGRAVRVAQLPRHLRLYGFGEHRHGAIHLIM